jgi:hypothetical protein
MKLKVKVSCPTRRERTEFSAELYYTTDKCPICKRRIGVREGMCDARVITSVDRSVAKSK